MVEPLRHRQTKEAATDTFYLQPPRHISTLPETSILACPGHVCLGPYSDRCADVFGRLKRADFVAEVGDWTREAAASIS